MRESVRRRRARLKLSNRWGPREEACSSKRSSFSLIEGLLARSLCFSLSFNFDTRRRTATDATAATASSTRTAEVALALEGR